MLSLLWLIPTLPLAGYLALVLGGTRLSRRATTFIGVGSVGVSAALTLLIGASFILSPPAGFAYTQTLWTWMNVEEFAPRIAFYLDAMSLIFIFVITFVGFLIHVYSLEYMEDDEGFNRFFAYMNLFVGSMLILVLADNLLLLYLGWEGVGLCSYLLIGFWYADPANGSAARKAFIVTRVGDTAMALGLFLLVQQLGTLDIQTLMARAQDQWAVGSGLAVAVSLLLLGGAVGKSAQLPLQTWLPDAMAGPTPVSALIHAATMVTAGVYLIARTHALFALAPAAQHVVAIVGAVTLLMAGFSALMQRDIKRVLAYSTISQIGYMFLGLGVGAWSAAVFHFMTHAFFKALLFLGAGAVIISAHHEQDIFKLGGLRKSLPVTFWTFLIASAALAGFPFVTAGFYSKDLILWMAYSSRDGSPWLWAAGLIGALLTAIYIFRLVIIAFFGEAKTHVTKRPGRRIAIPLSILAVLSIVAGFLELPGSPVFTRFLESALPEPELLVEPHGMELKLQALAAAASLLGILAAVAFFRPKARLPRVLSSTSWGGALQRLWFADWGFDWLYDRLFVRPFVWAARINKRDFVDDIYSAVAWVCRGLHWLASLTQTGRVRRYALSLAVGSVILAAIVLWF